MLSHILKKIYVNPKDSLNILGNIDELEFEKLYRPHFISDENSKVLFKGKVISTGACNGYLSVEVNTNQKGKTILVTEIISPSQIKLFDKIVGVVTKNIDFTGHAAIVARDKGLPVLAIEEHFEQLKSNILNGNKIGLDCFDGVIFNTERTIYIPKLTEKFYEFIKLLKKYSKITVHANADDIKGCIDSSLMKAEGLQPRTEYMIYTSKGLLALRKILFNIDSISFKEGIKEFKEVFSEKLFEMANYLNGKHIVVRLLDPPIHEFLPTTELEIQKLAKNIGVTKDKIREKIKSLEEINPMSGNRGVRLLITYPELLEVQLKCIFSVSRKLAENNLHPIFVINIPMVINSAEVVFIKGKIEDISKEYVDVNLKIGAMIETPASAILSKYIIRYTDYISFGTNDLTAQTFAFSRGDVHEKFLNEYLNKKILTSDPFAVLTPHVKILIKKCMHQIRKHSTIKDVAICGEHSIEKSTIEFCINHHINIISCSPSKIPLALLRCAIESLKYIKS